MAKSVAACFAAVLFRERSPVYVYRTETPRRGVTPVDVWDRCVTGEHWLIPPVRMVRVQTIPPDQVAESQVAIRLYHEETRLNSDLWLRVSQYAMAFDVLGGTEHERHRVQRCLEAAQIHNPEEYVLSRAARMRQSE